jgi:hypothetical protein
MKPHTKAARRRSFRAFATRAARIAEADALLRLACGEDVFAHPCPRGGRLLAAKAVRR